MLLITGAREARRWQRVGGGPTRAGQRTVLDRQVRGTLRQARSRTRCDAGTGLFSSRSQCARVEDLLQHAATHEVLHRRRCIVLGVPACRFRASGRQPSARRDHESPSLGVVSRAFLDARSPIRGKKLHLSMQRRQACSGHLRDKIRSERQVERVREKITRRRVLPAFRSAEIPGLRAVTTASSWSSNCCTTTCRTRSSAVSVASCGPIGVPAYAPATSYCATARTA